jgi:branched-chain amino acid transport system substrate-binding protein
MQSTPVSAQGKPIKIGYVGGITGPFAYHALPAVAGTKYVIEEMNQAGGFQGRKLELVLRDGKERPDVSLNEARNLVLGEGVKIIVGAGSGAVAHAISAFAKEQKVLFVNYPSGTQICGEKGHRYVFKPANNNSDNVGFSVAEYLAEKPWTKYYLIGTDYVFGHETIDNAWKRLTERKPNVKKLGELWPKFGERDYVSYITSIMASNPEVVIAQLPGPSSVDFIRQAKGLGFFKKIKFVDSLWTTAEQVALGKEMPQDIIGATEFELAYCTKNYPIAKKVVEKYEREFKDRNSSTAVIGYNSMLFVAEAMKKAGSADVEKIIDAMEGLEIDTGVGRVKCLKYSHRGVVPQFIGVTTFVPQYPFAMLKDVKVYQGDKVMFSEDEIRKMRGE